MCKLIFEVVTFIACARTQSVCCRLVAFLLHKQTVQPIKILHADGRGGEEEGQRVSLQPDSLICITIVCSQTFQVRHRLIVNSYCSFTCIQFELHWIKCITGDAVSLYFELHWILIIKHPIIKPVNLLCILLIVRN